MATARRAIREAMPGVDLVMEVLDARIPWSSQNPLVAELRGNKPLLRVLTKADLADPTQTARWTEHLSRSPEARVCVHALGQRGVRESILRLVRELVGDQGAHVPVAMIVGVPNVGKSSLLNLLAGRTLARAGNTPGLTQKQQRVDLGRDLAIVDTPGFLWPRLSPPECGERLAVTGAIPDRVTNSHALACFALRFLRQRYGAALTRHYKLSALPEEEEALLEAVGRRRGYLLRGGVVEIERAAERVLLDLREGAFGGLTLETPEDVLAPDVPAHVVVTKPCGP
jgi:ribosome biogenesis GTPase A